MKTCTKCQTTLPLSEYYHDCTRVDGHQSACKDCQALAYHGRKVRRIARLLQQWRKVA